MRVFLFHGSIFIDFQEKNSVIYQRATFENRLQFHRSIRCKQTNAVQQPRVHLAHALFECKTRYQCYFTYYHMSAIEARKGSCEDQLKHILLHSKLFTKVLVERSANRIFVFNRANPIVAVGSKIVG